MSSEADRNSRSNTRGALGSSSAPQASAGTTAAMVSRPTLPPAKAILVAGSGNETHHASAHYPPPSHYHQPPSYHPYQPTQGQVHPGQATHVQTAEANILSSMKKAPLATIVDNPAEDDEGGEEEFGKLSGRKLDSSFAEGNTIQNGNSTALHRAPTPLLLSPDNSTDGAAVVRDKVGASKDEMSSVAKVDGSADPSGAASSGRKKRISDSFIESKEAGDAPPSSKLSELDAMTCHNIEVFQATEEDAEAFDSSEAFRLLGTSTAKQVICGHVGFRCVHCFAGEDMPVATRRNTGRNVVYPASVGTISTALRRMRDHFDCCEAMSEENKIAFADARREQEEQDAGLGRRSSCQKSGNNGPDEWRRIAFLDFCVDFCQRKDIINIQPQRSGLKYRLPIAASSSAAVGAATGTSTAAMTRQGLVPVASLPPGSIPAATAVRMKKGQGMTGFPFFSDGYGAWICRYCCSVPYPYRGAGSVWNAPGNQAPPTRDFVDQHMKLCKGAAPPHAPPTHAPSTPHTPQMPPLPGSASQAKAGALGTTQKASPHQQLSRSRASPAGVVYTPQPYYPASPQTLRSPHMPPLGMPPHPYHPNPYVHPLPAQPPAGRPPIAPTAAMGKKPQRRGARAPPPTQKELKLPPGVDGSGSDISIQAAINYLVQTESSRRLPPPKDRQIELVSSEDKLLLTDYFSHLMRQLRLVRFSEADRKTRGGKREKVVLGYGGLECVHCIGQPGARKFFWSNVDRLSNSFAEIPAHILKCKPCAPEVKAALLELKMCHPKQMSRLPRGSQKVYFRRVWRRIHDADPSQSTDAPPPAAAPAAVCGASSVGTTFTTASNGGKPKREISGASGASSTPVQGNDESPSSMERSATKSLASLASTSRRSALRTPTTTTRCQSDTDKVANSTVIIGPHTRLNGNPNAFVDAAPSCGTTQHGAEALAHAAAAQSTGECHSHPIVMLAIQEDQEWLSDHDCFVRRNLEVFAAEEKDVLTAKADRKLCVTVGQVGIRCLHCAVAVSRYSDGGKRGARGTAVAYPHSISSIYECVKELHRNHLESGCPHLPSDVRSKIHELKGSMASSLSSVLRRYYVMAAKGLGMIDCGKEGIRAGGGRASISLGSSAEHEYAVASTRERDRSTDAGLPADAEHLRTRAVKAIVAATAASDEDANAVETGAAVVKTAKTSPKKNALPDPNGGDPSKGKAGAKLTRSTVDGSKLSDQSVHAAAAAVPIPEHMPQTQTHGQAAAPPVYEAPAYGYAPPMASVPPHYGYNHYGAYGAPPGAVQGSFLASAITPLESRKRKPARETDEAHCTGRPTSLRKL